MQEMDAPWHRVPYRPRHLWLEFWSGSPGPDGGGAGHFRRCQAAGLDRKSHAAAPQDGGIYIVDDNIAGDVLSTT